MTTTAWPEVPTLAFSRRWHMPTQTLSGAPSKNAGTRIAASKRLQPGFDLYQNGLVGLIQEADGLGRSISNSFIAVH